VHQRAALDPGEDGAVDGLRVLLVAEDEARPRAGQRLVGRRGDEVRVLDGVRMEPRTPSSDTVGQQVLQDMIAQQIALRNLIQLQIRPAYTQQLSQLRTTIETYNAQCTTRPRYVLDVEKAEQNLACPKP
jgi:hypothetical protein